MVDAMQGAPPNVNAHLWTDRKDDQALRISFAGPNGTEIEIPHSMLDSPKLRVSVHLQKELQTMVDKAPEPMRKTMREIQTHSVNENVGLRSDVIRQIVTTLYRRPEAETDMALNVYADCDTVRDMVNQRNFSVLRKARKAAENAPSGSDSGPTPLPDIVEEPKSGTPQHAKLTALALHQSLKSAQRTQCTIPKTIQATGFANYLNENDVIAAIPGSEAALVIAQNIESGMSNFSYRELESVRDESLKKEIAEYEHVVRLTMHNLSVWNEGVTEPLQGPLPTPTPEQILKMFHLAQQVLNIRPKLQEQIQELDEKAKAIDKNNASQLEERLKLTAQILSLVSVFNTCSGLIEGAVNLITYVPQVANATQENSDSLCHLLQAVVGAAPRIFNSDSAWKGNLTVSKEISGSDLWESPMFISTLHAAQFSAQKEILRLAREAGNSSISRDAIPL